MWRKAMLYLGLGPDEEYDDYDAGYEDETDFLGSCGTWGWEMAQLEEEPGALAAVCAERRDGLAAEDAACEDFTGIDWHTTPW